MQGRRSRGGRGGGGGEPLQFSKGKMFLFKKKVHAVSASSTCHFTPYPCCDIFREIIYWECWKYHFRASIFQSVLGEDALRPLPQQTCVSGARFQAPTPPPPPSLLSIDCRASGFLCQINLLLRLIFLICCCFWCCFQQFFWRTIKQ